MTDEQHGAWIQLAIIAVLIAAGLALVLNGHDEGYWFFVGVAWIIFGIL